MKAIRILLAMALAATVVVAAGCSQKNVAAKVNGEVITVDELNKQVDQLKKQYPQMFEGADGEGRLLDFKRRLLDNLINQELVAQAAEKQGLKVTDADVKKQIQQLKSGFDDAKQYEKAIKSAGYTEETLGESIRKQLMTQKLIESLSSGGAVSEADIKSYYEKNKTQFRQEAAKRASHILFKPEDKAKGAKVLAELKAGEDFAKAAKKYSVDTATAAKGGDLGWPSTPLVEEFQKAVDRLKVGQMSDLVKTPYGWHIIKVTEERKATQLKYEDVKDQIKQILVQQTRADKYQKYLDQLRKEAKIEIVLEELKESKASTETSATK